MSAFKKKIKGLDAAAADFASHYAAARHQREQTMQARILAEIEVLSKLNLSRETLIMECATRKVEQEIAAEITADYMRANEIIRTALDFAAPMADTLSNKQHDAASQPRGKVTDDGETISDLIARLAHERDALGGYAPASSLWEPLFAALQDAGADPKETRNNGEPRKTFYSYTTAKGTNKEIKRGTFENKISAYRKKLSR